ncbi:hypothetical protein L1987_45546 [Smallanthus sonchifolius]|uniref:Uncharacterized protein n=1 Tax=Smallanthus sonchifolius TaxID=185202 RepID=A0ACB9FXA6_9ASTR|nr:hypothetical protein L1987_45546 [Smallanthus sonchifolius]
MQVLYANDQSQGINDRHNGLHAISYFTTNTLNSLEDILGELFKKQLEAGEHTNKDNYEDSSTRRKCSKQQTINSVDIHGQVLYANDQSQGINDRRNGLHAISYFTTNTLNSLEDILGELFKKQLEAGEHTNKDNYEGTTDQKAFQQVCETHGVNVNQGWVQEFDSPGNIKHPILVEDSSTRRKCSKQQTINSVDIHGQVLYANDQSQGINDRHNGLHAISYFTTNTLNSLEDILGELFKKQLEAGEHTNNDNYEGTTDQKAFQQVCETHSVNVDQGWVQEFDSPGNIKHPILVEDSSTRKKCSKQQTINSVDIHGQVNEPILIDDRSTGNKSSKQQTSNTNTLEKNGNQDDKSTTSIRSTPERNVPMTQFINAFKIIV